MTSSDPPFRERVMNLIVQVRLDLPRLMPEAGSPNWMPISLCLLGVVRRISETWDTCSAHVRFLRRLPPEIDVRLQAWEQRVRAATRSSG
jgi:hypothetical protein